MSEVSAAYRNTVRALLALALVLAAYPLIRSFWHFEIDMNEVYFFDSQTGANLARSAP